MNGLLKYSAGIGLSLLGLIPSPELHAQPGAQPWKGKLSGEANFQSGNVQRALGIFRGEMTGADSLIEGNISGNFVYGEQNNIKADHSALIASDLTFIPYNRVYPFIFGSGEFNYARSIRHRLQTGFGGGVFLYSDADHRLKFSLALMFDQTDFISSRQENARWSLRLKGYDKFLGGSLRFSHVSFFQPVFGNLSDFRFRTLLTLDFPLTQIISLRSAFEDSYEHIVAPGTKQNDMRLTFGISATFE